MMSENSIKVPVINLSGNPLPQYATAGSSGMDVRAWLSGSLVLKPMERALIPTGISLVLPDGYEAQIRPRSGLALRQGITCLNSPGTIDADYRGEIKIILINFSAEDQTIQNGDRVAQLVVQRIEKIIWVESASIEQSERGVGGFGHTGKK